MSNSVKKGLLAVGVLAVASTSSFGAISAPDTAGIISDVTVVFTAILGVYVVIFGFKRIKSLL